MIGLDTNVIVRALTDDDADQSPAAQRVFSLLTPSNPGFISLIALVKTMWVLHQTYRYSRESVLQVVSRLLSTADLQLEQEDLIRRALDVAQQTNRELPDVLISMSGARVGCDTTLTFDRKVTAIPGMSLLTTRITPTPG